MQVSPPDADGRNVTAIETHISTLFFSGQRVYKLLKPLRTAFLDHRDTDRRIASVTDEHRLNRRLAPDVYLGLADVHEHGDLVDRMLVMRRLPDDRRLSTLLDHPQSLEHLRAVARAVSAFHASLEPVETPTLMSTPAGLSALWSSSFDDIEPDVGPIIDPSEFERTRELALGYLQHAEPLMQRRRELGYIRDGHGDLIADDIFMLDDGPRILDCLAFDEAYRVSDVLADIAFLVMDVERLAGVSAARRLMAWYCEFSAEHHPASLAHHYVAYRAHVRAKVALMRHRQGDPSAADLAQHYHRQVRDHLDRARGRMVLVGGGPGAGKTTTANAIADAMNWSVIDSDTLRKDLRGIDHHDHDVAAHPDLYSAATDDDTYRRLLLDAELLLVAGESVVVDATWSDAGRREEARALATRHGAQLIEIECRVDPSIARNRIAHRLAQRLDASDATPALVEHKPRDAWPEAHALDTGASRRDVAVHAIRILEQSAAAAAQYETAR